MYFKIRNTPVQITDGHFLINCKPFKQQIYRCRHEYIWVEWQNVS